MKYTSWLCLSALKPPRDTAQTQCQPVFVKTTTVFCSMWQCWKEFCSRNRETGYWEFRAHVYLAVLAFIVKYSYDSFAHKQMTLAGHKWLIFFHLAIWLKEKKKESCMGCVSRCLQVGCRELDDSLGCPEGKGLSEAQFLHGHFWALPFHPVSGAFCHGLDGKWNQRQEQDIIHSNVRSPLKGSTPRTRTLPDHQF